MPTQLLHWGLSNSRVLLVQLLLQEGGWAGMVGGQVCQRLLPSASWQQQQQQSAPLACCRAGLAGCSR
jgi:hypothetical protein